MPASSNIVTCGLPNTGSSLASALMVRSMHPPRAQTCRVHLERGAGVEQHGAAHGLAGLVFFDGRVRPAAALAAAQACAHSGLTQSGDAGAASGHDFGRGGLGDGRLPQRGRWRCRRGGAGAATASAAAISTTAAAFATGRSLQPAGLEPRPAAARVTAGLQRLLQAQAGKGRACWPMASITAAVTGPMRLAWRMAAKSARTSGRTPSTTVSVAGKAGALVPSVFC